MFERFFPDHTVASAYDIDFEKLYHQGYRGVLFDIDNTLVEHGSAADAKAKKLFHRLDKIGFEYCLISNMVFNAHKPARKGYYYAMDLMGTRPENTIFVGDQLFTDIFGAKRIGLKNYLVKPINAREEIQIVLKRKLEWIVLREYRVRKREEKRKKRWKRQQRKKYFVRHR